MDKKRNRIFVGCLALLLVMVAGYALFSQNLTINGTAKAQGNFDIAFTCTTVTSENATAEEVREDVDLVTKGGTGTCSIEGQTIKTTSTLNKPIDQVFYKVVLTNNGTIPAKIKEVNSSNNCFYDEGVNKTCPGDQVYYDKTNMLIASYELYSLNADGTLDLKGDMLFGDSAVEAANVVLQPGESRAMYFYAIWDDTGSYSTQPVLPEAGATINYNVELLFEQITN